MFESGINKNISDPKTNTIATFTLPVESLDRLNEMMEKGLKAGGTEITPALDEGFMLIRNIEDLDGHHWAIIFLDLEKFKKMRGK
jgi:predicted lactoylglutathione lyase